MPAASFDASQRKDFPKGETLVQQTVALVATAYQASFFRVTR